MEKLRDEIIEAQKSRSDLLKWKLIIVSALGAGGLGVTLNNVATATPLLLLFVPGVSLYVDILCYHLALRMVVIGSFLKCCEIHKPSSSLSAELLLFHDYEKFVRKARAEAAFNLEDWALSWSTVAFSMAVIGYGVFGQVSGSVVYRSAFIVVGFIGAASAIFLFWRFRNTVKKLENCELPACPTLDS